MPLLLVQYCTYCKAKQANPKRKATVDVSDVFARLRKQHKSLTYGAFTSRVYCTTRARMLAKGHTDVAAKAAGRQEMDGARALWDTLKK